MATQIHRRARGHLYIEEHMAAKGLSVEQVAGRIGVVRQTVFKWIKEQHRLDPIKMAQLASALDLDGPEQLWRPPGYSVLDAMSPEELESTANEIVKRLVARRA